MVLDLPDINEAGDFFIYNDGIKKDFVCRMEIEL